jgi:hypothetical protein
MRTWAAQWLWLLLWCIFGSIWCVTSGARIGPTYDEPFYLEEGLKIWRTGKPGGLLQKGTMPFPIILATAPVRAWELLRGRPFDLGTEFHEALAIARPATLIFWWLLIVYGFLLARRVGGARAGWLAVPLLACEPNLLANASLATTDIALTACLLMFVYHYDTGRGATWRRRVGLPGVLYGVALLAKASALAFGVLVMVTLEALHALKQSVPEARGRGQLWAVWSALWARPFRRDTVLIVLLGLVVTIVACGSDWQPERSFFLWSHTLREGPFASVMVWLSEHLRIFPNGAHALVRQIKHNIQGHGAYLLGQTSPRALWYFFPVALMIKLALPLLLLPLCLALLSPRSLPNRLMALAGVLLLFSFNCHVQIGIRLVFPLVVCLILGVAAALAHAWEQTTGSHRGALVSLTGGALVWMIVVAGSAWPDGLRYVNEAWGGSKKGYLCVGGSDYDWGQGLGQLGRWANGRVLGLLYYGTDPLAEGPPFERLNSLVIATEQVSLDKLAEQLGGRDLAVSIYLLYGPPIGSRAFQLLLTTLRDREPVARTDCFFVYRFPLASTDDPSAPARRRSTRR